jgi:hypothetical protein
MKQKTKIVFDFSQEDFDFKIAPISKIRFEVARPDTSWATILIYIPQRTTYQLPYGKIPVLKISRPQALEYILKYENIIRNIIKAEHVK